MVDRDGKTGRWREEIAHSMLEVAATMRKGERTFTLRHHVADGWLAFAHCAWCGSSFISVSAGDVEGKAALGWQRTMVAAVGAARENLADHEKHCSKKPAGLEVQG